MKKRKIKLDLTIPMGSDHDLLCWVCNKESAIYDMNPTWVFRPCWKCQKKIGKTGKILFRNNLPWFVKLFI